MLDVTLGGSGLARLDRARLVGVARRIMRNDADAEDCVQRALLSAARHGAHVEQLQPWLATVVVNVCRMELRARRRKRRDTRRTVHELDEDVVDGAPGPHAALEARELEAAIARAMTEWSPGDAALLFAAVEDDGAYAELAPRFGLTRSAFKTRISRIRRRLRAAIEASSPRTG